MSHISYIYIYYIDIDRPLPELSATSFGINASAICFSLEASASSHSAWFFALMLFIHSYANTFDDAAYRAAQLACDLPFKEYTGFYSCPLSATKSAYGNDEKPPQGVALRFSRNLSVKSHV